MDPLGKTTRVKKVPLLVIGVLGERGVAGLNDDQDDRILVPFSTFRQRVLKVDYLHMILASAVSQDGLEDAKTQIQQVLAARHGVGEGNADFTVGARRRDILLQFLLEAMALSFLGGAIGVVFGISLGLGIITVFTDWNSQVSAASVLLSVGFSAMVGGGFGL